MRGGLCLDRHIAKVHVIQNVSAVIDRLPLMALSTKFTIRHIDMIERTSARYPSTFEPLSCQIGVRAAKSQSVRPIQPRPAATERYPLWREVLALPDHKASFRFRNLRSLQIRPSTANPYPVKGLLLIRNILPAQNSGRPVRFVIPEKSEPREKLLGVIESAPAVMSPARRNVPANALTRRRIVVFLPTTSHTTVPTTAVRSVARDPVKMCNIAARKTRATIDIRCNLDPDEPNFQNKIG